MNRPLNVLGSEMLIWIINTEMLADLRKGVGGYTMSFLVQEHI